MDIKYKNEFEFLDLGGLDDRTKGEINVALSSGAATEVLQLPWDTGETDYYEADDVVSIEQDENQSWQSYDTEQTQVSYVETEMEGASVGVISTIPSAHVYSHPPPQIMTPMYGGMLAIAQTGMYEMGPDMNMAPYIQGGVGLGVGGGEYQQSQIYLQPQEMHEVTINRDNIRRRSHRGGRGNKRETNNRYNIDANSDMSGIYHPNQGQQQYLHHRIPRNMYQQNYYHQQHQATQDHQNPPQRQRPPPSYHPVNNAAYSQSIPRPVYTQGYSGVANNQYTNHARYTQSIPQNLRPQRLSHEIPKHNIKRNNESSPRPQASNYGPPPLSIQRKTTTTTTTTESSLNNSLNSSQQTNIDCVTTVILNNSKIEHSVVKSNNVEAGGVSGSSNSGDCNNAVAAAATTTTKYSTTTTSSSSSSSNINNKVVNDSDNSSNGNVSNSNKVPPVNLTIEHNIVATVNNKTCEIIDKADNNSCGSSAVGPVVNINSSIQVKQQKTDDNVELRKEETTVSLIQTEKTISNPEIDVEISDDNNIVKQKLDKLEEVEIEQKNNLKEEIIVEIKKKPDNNEIHLINNELSPIVTSPTIANTTTVTNTNTTTKSTVAESPGMSWAGILKKSSTDNYPSGIISNGKPTARITPLRNDLRDDQGDNYSSKLNSSHNEAPGNRQTQGKPRAFSSNVENTNSSLNIESNASYNRSDLTQEEYDPSDKFNDLDPQKTGEFLLKYQMEKQTVSLLPRGLINRNNYCYINSILQALLACPPFYNLLIALPYSKNSSRSNASNNLTTNMIRFVREFSPLSAGARLPRKDRAQKRSDEAINNVQSGIAFEPSYVYTMLKNTSCASVFSVEGRQEDAEEFLSCLLNGISDEMLEMMKLASNENPPIPNESEQVQTNNGEQEEWKVMGPKNKGSITRCTDFGRTPLSDIFRGQLRYRVSRAGEQSTDNVQPFFTLQLDIEKAESVKGALEILVGKDQLEGMTCSKTKREIEAWKQVTLEELPVILILHLKWFDYKLDGCSKILKSVEFPIDLKIDGKIISTNAPKKLSPKQKQYKLFAVTYHDGKEATKGHYVTDAFHVGYGGWVRYDDSSLRGVSENNVLNPIPPRVPYLLYYRRCDTIGNNQLNNDRIR